MPGPTPAYLAAIQAGLEPTLDMPADTITPASAHMAPPLAVSNRPSEWSPPDPLAGVGQPAQPSGTGVMQGYDPLRDYGPTTREPVSFVRGDAAGPPQAQAAPMPSPPPEDVDPRQVEFRPMGGGGKPAHEDPTRGPKQNAHLLAAFDPPAEAAQNIGLRNAMQANQEEVMYERQAEAAQQRQDAAERVAIRRQQEMQALHADYSDQVAKLGQMHLDQGRWWGNLSTGDKIGNTLAVLLGGFGGAGAAFSRVASQIDQDIEAQKFDYKAQSDQLSGKKTAFGMLMDRYQSEDAATAAARAAALDFTAAKVNGMRASWKGTESANETDAFLGKLASDRENTIAAGFKLIPAQAGGAKYQMAIRGHVAPGLFSEKDAQANFLKYQSDPAVKTDETITKGEVDAGVGLTVARGKAQAEHAGTAKDNSVVLPSGETVVAPGSVEAKELRELSAQDMKIRTLVARAKVLREEGFALNPGNAGELQSLQQQLRTAFSVSAKLGALSKDDIKIADGAVGNLTNPLSLSSAPDRALESYAKMVRNDVVNRVKTYSGGREAAPKATGKLPPSATLHGKK